MIFFLISAFLFQLHETGKHKIRLVYCHHCGALFGTKQELEEHEEIAHSWQPQRFYFCTICNAKCRSLVKLQKHEEYKHFPVSKIFHCPIEGCKFFHFIKTTRDDHVRLLDKYSSFIYEPIEQV